MGCGWLPDGRDPKLSGEVTLWDPRTGDKVWDIGRHHGDVYTVGFGRDSKTLISGGEEGCCYVWDLVSTKAKSNLDADWKNLRSADSKTVFQAMQRLTATPDRTVKLLKSKLTADGVLTLQSDVEGRRMANLVTSLLTSVRTPDAIRLLKRLANDKKKPLFQKAAANALVRLRRS